MREYIIALFCVCCVAAVIKAVSPENATKKYIEMICAICIISAIALPFFDAVADFEGFNSLFDDNESLEENYDEIYKTYLLEEGVASAENVISSSVCEQLGISDGAIRVVLYLDESGTEITSVTAVIGKNALDTDPALISSHIQDTLGVECEIVYELFDE